MIKYNDNELIYLIREKSEEAYSMMVEKYKPLIYTKIKKFHFTKSYFDETYEESLVKLNQAIITYDEFGNNSFNNYFNLLLERLFIDISKKRNKLEKIIYSDTLEEYFQDANNNNYNILSENNLKLSKYERLIFNYRFIEDMKPRDIAIKLNCTVKIIYDAIDRIRRKARNNN